MESCVSASDELFLQYKQKNSEVSEVVEVKVADSKMCVWLCL